MFVKPAHLGSSVGIVKVTQRHDLADALEQAFAHDGLVIVEALAGGVEVECGVLGAPAIDTSGDAQPGFVSEPGEIVFAGEWYDYDGQVHARRDGAEDSRADLRRRAASGSDELALEAFLASGCDGLARVDFFVDGETVLVNELNTMPGFTPTSVYAKLLDASGVPYPQLVDRLCRLALERHEQLRSYVH